MANATPADSHYIALTTYRRDGRPVTTPVWSAPLNGNLYVVTANRLKGPRRADVLADVYPDVTSSARRPGHSVREIFCAHQSCPVAREGFGIFSAKSRSALRARAP